MDLPQLCEHCRRVCNSRLAEVHFTSSARQYNRSFQARVLYAFQQDNADSAPSSGAGYDCPLGSDDLIRLVLKDEEQAKRSTETPQGVLHHSSLLQLAESASSGCHMCTLMISGVHGAVVNTELHDYESIYIVIYVEGKYEGPKEGRECLLDHRCWDYMLMYRLVETSTGRFSYGFGLDVNVSAGQKIFRPSDQRTGPVRTETLNRISRWAEECSTHETCNRWVRTIGQGQQKLPSRLLEVTNEGGQQLGLHLRDTEKMTALEKMAIKYAALSHCWGTSLNHQNKLLQGNIDSFSKALPIETLTRTFREAAELTSMMGLRYLWIDALCIVQDDADDWEREAPRMAKVYAQAFITIAATSARDGSEGLFRQNNLLMACEFKPSWMHFLFGNATVLYCKELLGNMHFIQSSPLSQRAWVFQENLLSRRTIHFAEDQIWWSCRSGVTYETSSKPAEWIGIPAVSDFHGGQWEHLVTAYTRAELTNSSDMLVALSGVAEAFAFTHGRKPEDYLAGLWISDIKNQLLWWLELESREPFDLPENEPYAAPSWSWASRHSAAGLVLFPPLKRHRSFDSMPWYSDFEIVKYKCHLTGGGPYGSLSEASLCVKTSLKALKPIRQSGSSNALSSISVGERHYHRFEEREFIDITEGFERDPPDDPKVATEMLASFWARNRDIFEYHADRREFISLQGIDEAYFLLIQRSRFAQDGLDSTQSRPGSCCTYTGLVLKPELHRKGVYRRIGRLKISETDRMREFPEWLSSSSTTLSVQNFIVDFGRGRYLIEIV